MTYETIKMDITSSVATITLNRPDDANALNAQMAVELFDASVRCSNDSDIRAVLITGTGKMFCAGGDLKDMHDRGDEKPAHLVRMATNLHAAITRFAHMDAPVIMAVNGTAAGGGFSLALAGDYVLAAEEAKFVSAYTASGLTPDGSSTFHLAKHVGLLRAKELLFTNRRLTAEEACAWGMVTKVVPAARLLEEAQELAANFATGPTKAYGGLKRLLLTAYSDTMETQLEKETQGISGVMHTHDGPHGLESFLGKKKPEFKGK
ncbi:MAG: enoyl-CoA hydratase [Hyphomicrobiales bacterium]|nr:enoyl-CoA hydratase [Hyphomicrobiales bacterium]MCP4999604.1 enoyl-CoA hydratase [Hyphomicrobiales bacterium]